jgi:putative membrane protein
VNPAPPATTIHAITRPHRDLLTYYALACLAFPPAFPFLILPAYFRYHTMRYRFTDEGISMSWGLLFRRETIINYARIQDIHLRSNFVERWLGLARVLVQTASGSAAAELTLEGLKEFEAVRDFLYERMRGVKETRGTVHPVADTTTPGEAAGELAAALRETAAELRALRETLAQRP